MKLFIGIGLLILGLLFVFNGDGSGLFIVLVGTNFIQDARVDALDEKIKLLEKEKSGSN